MANFKNDGSFLEQFLAGKGTDVATASAAYAPPVGAEAYPAYSMGYPGAVPAYGYGYPMMAPPYGAPPPPKPGEQPSKSLWVGNLPPDATESDLRREFSMFGMIEHVKLLHHKNCCFVNFSDIESSMKAYANSQGKMLYGQSLKIGYGKPDTHHRTDDRDKQPPCKNLWVGNLSDRVLEDDIRIEFEPYGRIERVKVLQHKNCAFVNFSSISEATRARNALTGKMFFDRPLRINYGKDDHRKEGVIPAGPPFAYPPADEKLHNIIVQTASMVVRRELNVEMFEAFIAKRESENAALSFLLGGQGAEYFRWKIHCLQNNIPDDQYVQRGDHRHSRGQLSAENRKELSDILQDLSGTKESIKSATNWISQHCYTISDVVSAIDIEINSNIDYDKKLFIFYVVNDVLGYCSQFRSDPRVVDPICHAFQEKMISILRAVYTDESPDRQDRVLKVLRLWATKSFYDENTIQTYEEQMKSDGPIPETNPEDEEEVPPWLRQDYNSGPPQSHPPWQPPPPQDDRRPYGEEPNAKRMRLD